MRNFQLNRRILCKIGVYLYASVVKILSAVKNKGPWRHGPLLFISFKIISKLLILSPHQVNNRTQKRSEKDNDKPEHFYRETHAAISRYVVQCG
jgi:hypothetical protein